MANLQPEPVDQGLDHSLVEVVVFSKGKPGSNWFKATLGTSLVMVFYPDDHSIDARLIEPRDRLFIAGLKELEVAGACDQKATCAPIALQSESFKKAALYRLDLPPMAQFMGHGVKENELFDIDQSPGADFQEMHSRSHLEQSKWVGTLAFSEWLGVHPRTTRAIRQLKDGPWRKGVHYRTTGIEGAGPLQWNREVAEQALFQYQKTYDAE